MSVEQNLTLLCLFLVAIAVGWVLGRRYDRNKFRNRENREVLENRSHYLRGINFLMNDEPDRAVDVFLDSLEVSEETLETHIALGNLLRRKGEVEKAVRIHQNLLSRPGLAADHMQRAQLELARDYHSAGLLDRAEKLLQEMVEDNASCRRQCLLLLVEIYRDEKEWEKAIYAGNLLKRRRFSVVTPEDARLYTAQSHFCCELAEAAFLQRDYLTVRRWIKQAFYYDKSCVRASLIWGRLQMAKGRYKDAIKIMKKIPSQNRVFVPETLELMAVCYQHQKDFKGYQKFLKQCLQDAQSVSVMLQLADSISQVEGYEAAAVFIGQQLQEHPSIKGLGRLLELQQHLAGDDNQNMTLLRQMIDKLVSLKPSYQCNHCGFTGKELHWLCPGCKSWGSVNLIQGIEGE